MAKAKGFRGVKVNSVNQAKRMVDELADEGVKIAKQLSPSDSGRLRKRIRILGKDSGRRYTVRYGINDLIYARQRELGGTIRPKKKKVLKFFWKRIGKIVFASKVHQRGSHFLLNSAKILQAIANKIRRR